MPKRRHIREPVSFEVVRQIASIIGPCSAAAACLEAAAEYGGPVAFWKEGPTLLLERLPVGSAGVVVQREGSR